MITRGDNRRRTFGAGLRAAICAGVLAFGVLPGPPAQAAAGPQARLQLDDMLLGAGSAGKVGEPKAYLTGAYPVLQEPRVTVDATDLAGKVTVTADGPYANCTTGTVFRCIVPDYVLYNDSPDYLLFLPTLKFVPTAQAVAGAQGTVKISMTAKGLPEQHTTATVTIGDSITLVAPGHLARTGQPGGDVTFPLSVSNAAQVPARGAVLLQFYSTAQDNAVYNRRFSNCLYLDDDVACVFDQELAPGRRYELAAPLTAKVHPRAPAGFAFRVGFDWETPHDAAADLARFRAAKPTAGSGGPLRLVEAPPAATRAAPGQTQPDRANNGTTVTVALGGRNAADQAALGATVRGAIGSTVIAKVGIRNVGTGRVEYRRDGIGERSPSSSVRIVVPRNTTVVSTTGFCWGENRDRYRGYDSPLGARVVICSGNKVIEVGETVTWDIGLRIDSHEVDLAGGVSIWLDWVNAEKRPDVDSNDTNNSATLRAMPPLPPGAGGGSTGGGATGGRDAGGGTAGGLPVTGVQTGLVAAVGLAMVAAGVLGYLAARRRRTRFTT